VLIDSRKRKFAAVTAAASMVLIGVGTAAYAAIPNSSTGVITGCRNNSTGALRVIDYQAGTRCKSGETTLNWKAAVRALGAGAVHIIPSGKK